MNKPRRYELTFPKTSIPPRQHAVVQARPEMLFRGDKIIAAESKSGATCILTLLINDKMQWHPGILEPVGIATANFDKKAKRNGIRFNTCEKDSPMTFIVVNDSDETVTWEAMMIGDAVK